MPERKIDSIILLMVLQGDFSQLLNNKLIL